MKLDQRDPPRMFRVGFDGEIEISHVADVELQPNEQVTFVSRSGGEVDVVRKDWGYYATPSVNRRLVSFGYQTALVQNSKGHVYVMVVESERMESFKAYCDVEKQKVLMWLDQVFSDDSLN